MAPASLQDWFEVHNLFVKYTTSLDRCDPEGVVTCFASDGVVDSPLMGIFKGREAIRAFAERTVKASRGRDGQFRHVVSNLVVEAEGDHANATCYLLDYLTADGTTELLSPGEYRCTLTRIDGRWLFNNRMVTLDQPFPIKL
jgi:ketosteroid isomerase-like protein